MNQLSMEIDAKWIIKAKILPVAGNVDSVDIMTLDSDPHESR